MGANSLCKSRRRTYTTAGKESIFFKNVHISWPQTRGIQWWTYLQSFRALELLQPSAGGSPIGVPKGAPKIALDFSNSFLRANYFCGQNPIFCPGYLWTYTMTKWTEPQLNLAEKWLWGLKKGLDGPKITKKRKTQSFSLKEAYFYAYIGKCGLD